MTEKRAVPEERASKTKGEVLREAWFYGSTFIANRDDPTSSLFVRRFREIKMPSGKVVLRACRDVEEYPNEDEMVAAIEERHMREWPEMDDNPPLTAVPDNLFAASAEDGCAKCGGPLTLKVGDPLPSGKSPVWLCCVGCGVETRVGPIIARASLPMFAVASATEGPQRAPSIPSDPASGEVQ